MPDQLGSFVIILANCTMTRNNMKFNQEGRRRAFHMLTVITKLAGSCTATSLGAVRTLLNKYDKEEDERSVAIWAQASILSSLL